MTKSKKMTVKATIYCLMVTMLTILTEKTLATELDYNYTCPTLWKEPCKCAPVDKLNTEDIKVDCEILKIMPDSPDFSLIQGNHTTVLSLKCDNYLTSELHNGMFQNLNELEELVFSDCKIKRLIPGAFQGLDQLRMLNISFVLPQIGFWKRNMTIEPNSFSHTSKLELVSFPYSGITNVPKGLFCGLQQMKFIDLTGNELTNELEVGHIDENFKGTCLPKLKTLKLARNQFKMLNVPLVQYTPSLEYLYLGHNKITSISSNVLSNLTNLVQIQLSHNELTEISSDIFKGFHKLEQVYLDSNQISCLSTDLFIDNANLTVVYLGHNKLSTNCLPKINHLDDLQELDLSYNQLRHLPNNYFQEFSKMRVLHLEGNGLTSIDQSMFYSFTSLQHLNISNNSLTSIIFDQNYAGDAFPHLGIFDISYNQLSHTSLNIANFTLIPNLQQLWLQRNQLSKISKVKDLKLTQLSLLNLEYNQITEITSDDFLSFPLLQYLSLNNNNISYLPTRVFASSPELISIKLSWNYIKSFDNDAFNDLPNLRIINLTHNQIMDIDLVFTSVSNLQVLDLSHNLIQKIKENDLPATILHVDISHNKIDRIDNGTISKLPSLVTMDLTYNNLSKIYSGALIRSPQSVNRPSVLLAGNYFFCDCNMYYMHDINTFTQSNSHYVIVGDLNSVTCHSLTQGKQFQMLPDLNPEDFLCNYCPTTTPGCEDASENYYCSINCPCKQKPQTCHCCQFCPDKCICSKSGDHKYNRIDCMNTGLTKVPENPLPYATHVHLDGNHISSLLENDFEYQSDMKVLYLNGSEIQNISAFTFQNLSNLETLYLNYNLLTELKNETFIGLENLKQLFLQNNTISHIEINAFEGLVFLTELHLENNNLSTIDLDIFDDLHNIRSYYLADNPWHCDCQFGSIFQTWIRKNTRRLKDMPVCETLGSLVKTNSSTDHRVTWIDFKPCQKLTKERTIHKFDKAHIAIIIGVLLTLILFIIGIVLIYRYRDQLQAWLNTNYGFCKVKPHVDKDLDAQL